MTQSEILVFFLFNLFILIMLALDLGVFHRKSHVVSVREASIWSVVWVTLSLLFNVLVYFMYEYKWLSMGNWNEIPLSGADAALQFLTGYILEKSLSVDNIFVFIVIFSYFGVPKEYQHKVLFWGVVGALIMRALFIAAGAILIAQFDWIFYLFGLILVVSGWKMMRHDGAEVHPDRNIVVRLARRVFPVSSEYAGERFITRKDGRLVLTPLFLVLLTVETTDVVFAVDSIPAIFAITRDPFLVYSSNVCAILGLRALYFVLAGMMSSFSYLKYGLALILILIGIKMLIADFYHVPVLVSLILVAVILTGTILLSLMKKTASTSTERKS